MAAPPAGQTIELKVSMACKGCSGAVSKALDKVAGIESVDIDMKEQKVTVKGNVDPQAIFLAVQKTGKKTTFWEPEANVSQNGGVDAAVDDPKEPVALKA